MTTPFLILLMFLTGGNCANILVIHALYSGSPALTWRAAGEFFARNGHQMHYLRWKDSHYHPPMPHPNMTETVLSINNENGTYSFVTPEKEGGFDIPFDILLNEGTSYRKIYWESVNAFPLLRKACEDLLSNKELINYLKSMNFHLAIVDLVANECSLALAHHLKLPIVGFWGMQFASGETTMTSAFLPPSHAPNLMSQLTEDMTFFERIYNVGAYLISKSAVMWMCWNVGGLVEKHLPGTPNPCVLLKELDGMIINSDHIMDTPQLLPPTFVRAGGLHIKDKLDPLSSELKDWMQSSGDDGVVVFAAGYTMNTNVLSKRFINAFFQAASRLPQKFLMKLEGRYENVPKNVKIMNWINQQAVLANNHTRLFVTHCGLQSVTESIYYGVPMVGMPIFFDQGDYLRRIVKHGVGIQLNRETATPLQIHNTLRSVLNNPKFKYNAKRLSKLMRDSPQTPQQRALELVEYLIRHKGAPHLKMASRHLNFFQYFCLDIVAFILISAFVGYKLAKFSVQWVFGVALYFKDQQFTIYADEPKKML